MKLLKRTATQILKATAWGFGLCVGLYIFFEVGEYVGLLEKSIAG